ncbi:hypothetical protein B0O80DRAFT_498385 [Mortierella sp. GBAus27b]|nr:hypothetical protein BGX31_004325 [Mortierella sp. GBA43]KAI8354375.1 hypothetical protein B0O80DRAFT_498385 [Mortierella sp. GBAus27b]
MSGVLSQDFHAHSSSKTISIPTRHDPKSRQRIVRWKDIQQCFADAQYVMCGRDVAPFLTDDDLEDLVPLRIAHHPGVILEVVTSNDDQGNSQTMSATSPSNSGHVGGAMSVSGDVASLRTSDIDDSQAIVLRSTVYPSETVLREHPIRNNSGHGSTTEDSMMQEQIYQLQQQTQQLQQQMDDIVGKMQQADQQVQDSHQHLQQRIDDINQKTQMLEQQEKQLENFLQAMQKTSQDTFNIQQSMEQQTENLLLKIQEMEQQIPSAQQQMQKRIEDALQAMQQQSDQQRQQLDEVMQTSRKQVQQRFEGIVQKMQHLDRAVQHFRQYKSQEALKTIERSTLLHRHIRATLAMTYKELPVPRLFVVLPEPPGDVDEQEEPSSPRFRLYFLCECGVHTMKKSCSDDPHKVHLTKHPGYGLVNHDEFFRKYGSYLLTIMYAVKYGGKTDALVVLPMLGLTQATQADEENDSLSFARRNINQLVDDMIAQLEDILGTFYTNTDIASHQTPDALDLGQLKSYLKVKEGETSTGDMGRISVQDEHSIWVCNEHWREYHESALGHLKYLITVTSGEVDNKIAKVNITSEILSKTFYDAIVKLRRIQPGSNWQSLTEVDLNLEDHSVSTSTTTIFDEPNNLESISMDFGGRLSLVVDGLSSGEVKNVAIVISSLRALQQDDLEFIRQSHPVSLTITSTPERSDETRLISILQNCPVLEELHVGSTIHRLTTVISLVTVLREKILLSGGQSALRIFRSGTLVSSYTDDFDGIMVIVSFSEDIFAFEVESHFKVQNDSDINSNTVRNFIRQFGWSIKTLRVGESFGDQHAVLIDEATVKRGSKIECLDLVPPYNPQDWTTSGPVARVIKRALGSARVRLTFWNYDNYCYQTCAPYLIGQCKDRLTSLHLGFCNGRNLPTWVSRIIQGFPARGDFPVLEELRISFPSYGRHDTAFTQWIITMVSTPPPPLTPLKAIHLSNVGQWSGWKEGIEAIDLSKLETLSLPEFGGHLEHVVGHIESSPQPLPLRLLDLQHCSSPDKGDLHGWRMRVQQKAPQAEVRF